jgi:hypothetical protein
MSNDVLSGLEIPNFVKNIANKKMKEYFENPDNDVDLELIFQKILSNLQEVKYP